MRMNYRISLLRNFQSEIVEDLREEDLLCSACSALDNKQSVLGISCAYF